MTRVDGAGAGAFGAAGFEFDNDAEVERGLTLDLTARAGRALSVWWVVVSLGVGVALSEGFESDASAVRGLAADTICQ